jgi:hypothetical protein
MARILKPPTPLQIAPSETSIFLAGSIEMGGAEDWQARVEQELADLPITILNPRRDAWDASWEQSIKNPQFRAQVEWELVGQEQADIIAMYFAPTTKAPITLLELGLFARTGKLLVCCPDGFWRKGNVEIVCDRFSVPLVSEFELFMTLLRQSAGERLRRFQ